MFLRLKKKIDKEEMTKLYNESYVTEVAYIIGSELFLDEVIDLKLLNIVTEEIDKYVVFHLFVKFMVKRFVECDCVDIGNYIREYCEDDLEDFVNEYFEKIEMEGDEQ